MPCTSTPATAAKAAQRDSNFQGFGRFTTASDGGYRFRTIKPVAYPGRPAPHIHVKVKQGDRDLLTTQIFVRGKAGNDRDSVFRGIRDPKDRDRVLAEFEPLKESKIGEFTASGSTSCSARPPTKSRSASRPATIATADLDSLRGGQHRLREPRTLGSTGPAHRAGPPIRRSRSR